MTKSEFWAILDACRRESGGDTEVYYQLAQRRVLALELPERTAFRAWLGAYQEIAVESVWLDMACKVMNGYVSDDTGLYFALWVIAQGESVLLGALRDPDTLADLPDIPFELCDFEMLMGVGLNEEEEEEDVEPDEDFFQRCCTEIERDVVFKNGDKFGGYESFDDAMEDIPNHLPNLMARAQKQGFDWRNAYE